MHAHQLFLLICLQCSFILNAQYIPLPLDTNHYWQQLSTYKTSAGQLTDCHYSLKVEKDSLVNGTLFKFITTKGGGCSPFYYSNYFQNALIRQDTAKKIVTMFVQGAEKILYNFHKNVGDTAILYNHEAGVYITHTVIAINSFIANDGLNHRRFEYNDLPVMIDGVGSEGGLLTPWNTFEKFHSTQCLWDNSTFSTIYNIKGTAVNCPLPLGLRNSGRFFYGISVFADTARGVIRVSSVNKTIYYY